jgi:hypothetical protein
VARLRCPLFQIHLENLGFELLILQERLGLLVHDIAKLLFESLLHTIALLGHEHSLFFKLLLL